MVGKKKSLKCRGLYNITLYSTTTTTITGVSFLYILMWEYGDVGRVDSLEDDRKKKSGDIRRVGVYRDIAYGSTTVRRLAFV